MLVELLPPLNAWRGYASRELEGYALRAYELAVELPARRGAPGGLPPALFTSTFVQGRIVESHELGSARPWPSPLASRSAPGRRTSRWPDPP